MTTCQPKRSNSEIGWRETIALPGLGIDSLNAKIDTGARTSALHAVIIGELDHEDTRWIEFDVVSTGASRLRRCRAPIFDTRKVKNTSGVPELRYVIETNLTLGRRQWRIELFLADREQMKFDLILGRTALRNRRICIDPGRSYLAGLPRSFRAAADHSI